MNVLHDILARSDFSPRTKSKYKLIIDRWLAFAGTDPAGWTREQAQAWYDALLDDGVSIPSANVYVASLRYVSRWYATRTNKPEADFAIVQTRRGRDTEGEDDGPPRALTEDEIRALLAVCASGSAVDRRDRALLIVGLETGMRRMSLQAMGADSLIEVGTYRAARVPIKSPGGRGRYDVPLSDLAALVLDDWMAYLHARRVRRGPLFVRVGRNGEPIAGDRMSPTAITHMIAGRAHQAKIGHAHPHLLRHTFVTSRTVAGLSVFEIAAITGHKVPGMGAAATYMDLRAVIERARNSTPPWFDALVRELLASTKS